MIKRVFNYISKYKIVFTIGSFVISFLTFIINEDTRNFVWNHGWLFPFIISFLLCIVLILFISRDYVRINNTDKQTYNTAMSNLIYDNVDYYFNRYDMGGPISYDQIKRFYNFRAYTSVAKFHIKNKKLRKLVFAFRNSLNIYLDKLSLYTSPETHNPDIIRLPKELEIRDRKEWEKRRNELNTLATKAFNDFEILVKFAKEKEIDNSM